VHEFGVVRHNYCLMIPTEVAYFTLFVQNRMSRAISAWVITLLNTTLVSLLGFYVCCELLAHGLSGHLLEISMCANTIFLINIVLDSILGLLFYPDQWSRSGIIHHIVYVYFTYFHIMPSVWGNIFFSMFLIEELPIIVLSFKQIKPEWFSMEMYCWAYVALRVVFHCLVGALVAYHGSMDLVYFGFFILTLGVHCSFAKSKMLKLALRFSQKLAVFLHLMKEKTKERKEKIKNQMNQFRAKYLKNH